MAISLPVNVFHNLIVPSSPPERIYSPFCQKVTDLTGPECPLKVLISFPLFTSQSLMVLSALPEIMYFPFGEKQIEYNYHQEKRQALLLYPNVLL